MNLANYQTITLKNGTFDELSPYLTSDINLRYPVVFSLLHLDREIQREMIGLIENYFSTNNLSFLFPYPVYLVTVYNQSLSRMPIVNKIENLPKFFLQKDGKMNAKETSLVEKSKMVQQEVKNIDTESFQKNYEDFTKSHKQLFQLSLEKKFYQSIIDKLKKD